MVTHVLDGGAAQAAGIAAGDAIIAVDGLRPGSGGLDALLAKYTPGERILVQLFRRDVLLALKVRLARSPRDTCVLSLKEGRENSLARSWLAGK